MARFFRILEIDRGDFGQRKVPFIVTRRADHAFHGVARTQGILPEHVRADIDVIGSGQVIRLW